MSQAAPATRDEQKDIWSADVYSSNASFVYSSKFTSPVIDLLSPQPGETILDLGCGHGQLTLESLLPAVLPAGSIIGLDSSADLLATARSSATKFSEDQQARVRWIELDGHDLITATNEIENESVEAVFSNAALHWMKRDPQRVIEGVYRVLKPGGRFVAEMGGFLNMIGVRQALHAVLRQRGCDPLDVDPWFFPGPIHYRRLLENVGFQVENCDLVPRPTPLPTGLKGWLETFAFAFFAPLKTASERAEVIEEVCKLCEIDMKDSDSGEWMVMYSRLRFKAIKNP
ncbi:class I SAM-dependent methyltransferase [Sporobolomyces salmoneus]|uniref:class I SAM-dependent methyltransferase n=1 Tax=Sporobolomyces salmoneus TaxID=183962 RepID=UPI00316F9BA3